MTPLPSAPIAVTPERNPDVRRRSPAAGAAFVVLAACLLPVAGCGGGGPPAPPPPGVNVAAVVAKPVNEWTEFSGRIEAIDSVELRPRVTGYLEGFEFHEGGEVHKGDLLFTIDDREYRAACDNARANLARAATRLEVAGTALARSEKLATVKAASIEELEQRRGEVKQAAADRDAALAQLRQAELTLSFTRITAPISGRMGRAEVRPGNLVIAGTTLLSVLVSIDPVYVAFDGDERVYLRQQALARRGINKESVDASNPVRVGLASETGFPHEGRMEFVDNQLDPATGTIRARGILSNKDHLFTPGLFARVQLIGASTEKGLLIHDKAVMTDQDRRYVYVLGPKNRVLRKDVTLGGEFEGLRIVTGGLAEGDQVVVNGTRKIFGPGQEVDPFTVPMNDPTREPPSHAATGARS
jgi:multidrug efflux system membrane fusion protein